MSKNLYKDYYETMNRDDEWSKVDEDNIRKKIKEKEYVSSFNECDVEHISWEGMGN